MGDIRVDAACAEGVECMMIETPDKVIELYERKILQDKCLDDYTAIWELTERRHPFLKA